jgi:UDP-N-acetylmuramyl pentapeptide synthase
MNNVILHKNDDGSNAITYIAKGYDATKIQQEIGGIEISAQIKDMELDFINAYFITNNTAQINLEKARGIKLEQIRKQRDEAFIEFDKRYEIALRDEIDLTDLKAERQKLKDAPQKVEDILNSCININEIKSISLASTL